MNPIKYLTDQDFSIQDGKKGPILANNLKGVSIVLFYSKKCPYCGVALKTFLNLAKMIPNCTFAMLNVSTFYNVAQVSQKTIAPIDVVPYIVLYVNTRPFMRYNGEKTEEEMGGFIMNVLNHIQSKKNFSTMKIDHIDELPKINGAIPFNLVCDSENSCYLSFGEAYSKDGSNNNRNDSSVQNGHSGYGALANQERQRLQGQDNYMAQRNPNQLNGLMYGQSSNPQRNNYDNFSGM
jgi:hypothetical protein